VFRVAYIEWLYCVNAFRMGSRNSSFTSKSWAWASIGFLTVSFPGLWTVGTIREFVRRYWGKTMWLVIVPAEIRNRRCSNMSETLPVGPIYSIETFDNDISYGIFCSWYGTFYLCRTRFMIFVLRGEDSVSILFRIHGCSSLGKD
jgi:hypothetical protein